MEWKRRWGDKLDFLRQIEEDTGETPPALKNAPLLEGELQGQYHIFLEVARNRAWTQGGPLPLSDSNLLHYFQANLIPKAEWSEIRDFVSRFDDIWLREHFAAAEANKPTKQA